MGQIAYVNGDFVAETDAKVSIFDRGFLFGDGVYEVIPVVDGRLINRAAHRERLSRSLREMKLTAPVSIDDIERIQQELVARNHIVEGRVYMQVTRGPAERDFAFPKSPEPTLIMFARAQPFLNTQTGREGIKVKTTPDTRWARRDIKTVMLLPGSLAKQDALDDGFDDAWFVQDGYVTEGTSNNAFIIKDGAIYTRPLSNDILPGCTRRALLKLCTEAGITLREEAFSVEQAYDADEAFSTSATSLVNPVVQIDSHVLANGTPGPLTVRLREIYVEFAKAGG